MWDVATRYLVMLYVVFVPKQLSEPCDGLQFYLLILSLVLLDQFEVPTRQLINPVTIAKLRIKTNQNG